MRVLGIDCGTEYTGYGVAELFADGRLHCCTSGTIRLSARDPLPRRLSIVFARLQEVIQSGAINVKPMSRDRMTHFISLRLHVASDHRV